MPNMTLGPSRQADIAQRILAGGGAWVLPLVTLLLAGVYLQQYMGVPDFPGNPAAAPWGWWGWYDQSVTLRSTAALAAGNLDPLQHHYPIGYALMGVPGYLIAPLHAFAAIDLAALLGALAGFVAVARRLGLPSSASSPLFALAVLGNTTLFRQWVIPWNTTPVAALIWILLACAAAWMEGKRRPIAMGLVAGLIVACRPSEAMLVAIPLVTVVWTDVRAWHRHGYRFFGGWLRICITGTMVMLPVVTLHLAIYGPHPSDYMLESAHYGFTLHDAGWKAYVLLLDPYSWFADGYGLFQREPWLVIGLAGLLLATFRGGLRSLLAACLFVHCLLYVCYVDLLPTGMWRYLNVHYFLWTIPGYALLAVLLTRDLFQSHRLRVMAFSAVVSALALVGLRFDPQTVGPEISAKAIDFDGPLPPYLETYFGRFALADDGGIFSNKTDMRVFVSLHGIQVISLRRDFVGPVHWLPGLAPPGYENVPASRRLAISLRWTLPPHWWPIQGNPRIPVAEQ